MFSRARFTKVVLLAVFTIGIASMASAQAINSGAQPIALTATMAESLSVSLSGSAVSFTLTPGSATNAGSTNITATTSWLLAHGRTAVKVYAWFASTNALTDGNGNNIPTSAFYINDNGAGLTAVTSSAANTAGFGAASAGLLLSNNSVAANLVGSATDAMAFNINLSSLATLPAGSYTGTLNIQAQATP